MSASEPTMRRVRRCPRPGVTLSRIAVTGSMRVARRAGMSPEIIVATMPMTRPMITVMGLTTRPVVPRSIPPAASSAARPGATTRPASTPRIEATTPTTKVSISTERRICPREAPSTRSSANSFVRWATVTVNVLKIRKPPTSSATPANTSSAMRRKPSASAKSCAVCSAASSPVRTRKSRPSSRDSAALTCSASLPPVATEIES